MSLVGCVNWEEVETAFRSRFLADAVGKHIYLDFFKESMQDRANSLRIIEDAKEKWCRPVLLDAIVCLYRGYDIVIDSRRSFNQHTAFRQALETILLQCDGTLLNSAGFSSTLKVEILDSSPWSSIHQFERMIVEFKIGLRAKSKEKIDVILEVLSNQFRELTLPFMMQGAIQMICQDLLERNHAVVVRCKRPLDTTEVEVPSAMFSKEYESSSVHAQCYKNPRTLTNTDDAISDDDSTLSALDAILDTDCTHWALDYVPPREDVISDAVLNDRIDKIFDRFTVLESQMQQVLDILLFQQCPSDTFH